MPKLKIDLKKTTRGFVRADFTDVYNAECSIQESSVMEPRSIWLGVNNNTDGVFRMLLSQDMVKALLPSLKEFAKTGVLISEKEYREKHSEEIPI